MKANLVCKGGGIKGIALVGAISCLEERGYEWENLAGTSAGAIITSLLAVGYNSNEIKNILYDINYENFKDKNRLQYIPLIGDFLSVFIHKGIYSGNCIENFLHEKFKAKNKTKFKDISVNGKSKLKMIAVDVTRGKLLILPDDLVDYGIDPMEFEISKAVRMSLSIPLYYYPVKIKTKDRCCFIVDGGLLSNFPIWVFDTDSCTCSTIPTFGLNLSGEAKVILPKCQNSISYLLSVIHTSLSTNEDVYFKEKDALRIINIPTLNISTTDFDLSKTDMSNLYNSGYNSAYKFLDSWNFEHYISKYGF